MSRDSEGGDLMPGSFAPGGLIAGRYRLEGALGRGRTSRVFLGTDQDPSASRGARIALKILREELWNEEHERAALCAEGERLRGLTHPHVVACHGVRTEGGIPILLLEPLPRGSVRDLIRAGRRLSPLAAGDLLEGAAAALAYLHATGWTHADIKPAHLRVSTDGATTLIDLGSARRMDDRVARRGERILTPAYASCEVMEGEAPDPRDDVFALAVIAYELIAGRHPFSYRAPLPSDFMPPVPGLPRRAASCLAAALAPHRAARPRDPRELVAAIRAGHPIARFRRRYSACPV